MITIDRQAAPVAEGIERCDWLATTGAEVLLRLGSSERRRCRLATVGASATAVAAIGNRLAAVEVAGGEEQQLLQIWWKGSKCPRERAAIEGEGCGYVAAAVVAAGRKKRQRSDCRLEGAEPDIIFDDCSRGQRRVIGASGCSALLPWLKGTLGCEGAPRVAVGEEALAVGREVGGGVGCAVV
ncbi:hypothetical protein B296_00026786 [Ensete ventricosum]|uniref:Uncharacterized protein n=1 Tax=Ensete ventricosum TaxID=4639 RepID=A0A426YPU4_ENSVE|nr:hypothetical protein B296_00026786 [Ensete ventricosum]